MALLTLVACDSPAPAMWGAERDEFVRNGHDYVLYHTEDSVELIRLGHARRGEHQAIRAEMIDMIPVVTGCRLVESSIKGDSGEMRGKIDCPGS